MEIIDNETGERKGEMERRKEKVSKIVDEIDGGKKTEKKGRGKRR